MVELVYTPHSKCGALVACGFESRLADQPIIRQFSDFYRNVFWKNIGCRFESYCAWAAYSLMGELLLYCLDYAAVAQLVERHAEDVGVVGSTPARGTSKMYTANFLYADSKSVAERLRKCKSYPLPPLWESREVVKPGGTDLI